MKTGTASGAATSANVFVQLYGSDGHSGELHLRDRKGGGKAFQNGSEDEFVFENVPSLGTLAQCRVWHDNKGKFVCVFCYKKSKTLIGFGAAWYLEAINVIDNTSKILYSFPCQKWLSTKEDDGQISRTLPCAKNSRITKDKDGNIKEVEIKTGSECKLFCFLAYVYNIVTCFAITVRCLLNL